MDKSKLLELTTGARGGGVESKSNEVDTYATSVTELSEQDHHGDINLTSSFLAELSFWDVGGNASEVQSSSQVPLEIDIKRKSDNWMDKLMNQVAKLVDHIDREVSKMGEKLLESQQLLSNWGDMKALDNGDLQEIQTSKDLQMIDVAMPSNCNNTNGFTLEGPELEMYISHEMEKHIRNQISYYLQLMKPITFDLEELFEELNMNDPSKV
jgi:hypothetical protein